MFAIQNAALFIKVLFVIRKCTLHKEDMNCCKLFRVYVSLLFRVYVSLFLILCRQ